LLARFIGQSLPTMTDAQSKTFWLISVPKRDRSEEPYDEVARTVLPSGEAREVHKLELPELRVGTLDSLMTLSDELGKYDHFIDSVVKKIGTQL